VKNASKKLPATAADANIGIIPEHLIASPEKDAMIGGALDLVE